MRLTDSAGEALSNVNVALSDEEARELFGAALENLQRAERGWHEHVSDAASQVELTVYREDNTTAVI